MGEFFIYYKISKILSLMAMVPYPNMVGGSIKNIFPHKNKIDINIDTITVEAQKRSHERFPVSLYADIIQENSKKRNIVILKDLSFSGIQIHSKVDFNTNSNISMDIYLERNVISINATIIRKVNKIKYFEYGLKINYNNVTTMNFIKDYIQTLRNEQINTLNMIIHNNAKNTY
jgi:hypothetical protein